MSRYFYKNRLKRKKGIGYKTLEKYIDKLDNYGYFVNEDMLECLRVEELRDFLYRKDKGYWEDEYYYSIYIKRSQLLNIILNEKCDIDKERAVVVMKNRFKRLIADIKGTIIKNSI